MGLTILTDKKYKDNTGDSIYFKGPYFDTALRRRFNSIQEKHEFMKKHNIVSAGDDGEKFRREKKEHEERTK